MIETTATESNVIELPEFKMSKREMITSGVLIVGGAVMAYVGWKRLLNTEDQTEN